MQIILISSAFLASSCGIPNDSEPRAIDPANVQYDLLAPSTTTPPAPGPVVATVSIYLLGPDNKLVAVQRQLGEQKSVSAAVGALLQGATSAELAMGLRSAIDQQTVVLGAQSVNGVAQIDVSDALLKLAIQDQILALAEIVYTATGVEGINAVRIRVNSLAVDVPRSDGSMTHEEIRRNDYTALAPA